MQGWKVLLRLVRGPRCVPIQQRAVGGVSAAKDGGNRWKRMEFDEQSATGFENASMLGLLRAAVVVRLSASDYISNNAITLMHQAKRLVGKRLFDVLMRGSFYGHFCVGERREEIEKSTKKLFQNNVRPMLLVTIEEESRDNNASKRRRPSDLLWLGEATDSLTGVAQAGYNAIQKENQETYGSYLKLEPVLNAQVLASACDGKLTPVHEEHLFIVTHQTFELWLKQILYELDSVREIFAAEYLEERNQLTVISRLHRVAEILKLLCNQFPILETMTPQDFLEMRPFLGNSSGFQSFQFRMLEITLGMKQELRVLYNKKHFLDVFFGEERRMLEEAMDEKSLFDVVNDWLERTPGLEEEGFNFFCKFKASVNGMLRQEMAEAEECADPEAQEVLRENVRKREEVFNSLFEEEIHNNLVRKGQRRFSHRAMQGALMVYLYRDEPRCHLPFQLFQCLMEIDSQMTKFRYSHTCMVQRMIGGKIGTGGSSGYLYLRSTCSDRYKVFLDLINLSSFLVTRDRIPPLTQNIKRSLSVPDWIQDSKTHSNIKVTSCDSDEDSEIIASRFLKTSISNCDKSIEPLKD